MSDIRDPKEVLEMREAMAAFRKAARGVKQSHPGFPRISTRLTRPAEASTEEKSTEDDTTKKLLVPA